MNDYFEKETRELLLILTAFGFAILLIINMTFAITTHHDSVRLLDRINVMETRLANRCMPETR